MVVLLSTAQGLMFEVEQVDKVLVVQEFMVVNDAGERVELHRESYRDGNGVDGLRGGEESSLVSIS